MIISTSEEKTRELGEQLAQSLIGGEVITLSGDLGAGKTVFVKGLASGLGITKVVTSPTFVLMKVYACKKGEIKNFVHIDTYRLGSEQDLVDIGIMDYLGAKDSVVMIEWPEKVMALLEGKKVISVELEHSERDVNERVIKIGK